MTLPDDAWHAAKFCSDDSTARERHSDRAAGHAAASSLPPAIRSPSLAPQKPTTLPASERSSPYSDMAPYSDRDADDGEDDMGGRAEHVSEADQKYLQKVNQVIQVRPAHKPPLPCMPTDVCENFFTKAALTIISSRTMLPQSFNKTGHLKQNKWVRTALPAQHVC